jgi:hypothetical protein
MHICLQIAEILTNIFETYNGDKEALDALWVFQRSFLPLLKTFPADVLEETGTSITISPSWRLG